MTTHQEPFDLESRLIEARPKLKKHFDKNRAKMELAIALISARKAAGLTQGEVAAAAGWKQPFVSRMEAPTGTLPSLESVIRYARACNTEQVVIHIGETPRISLEGIVCAVAVPDPEEGAEFSGNEDESSSIQARVAAEPLHRSGGGPGRGRIQR